MPLLLFPAWQTVPELHWDLQKSLTQLWPPGCKLCLQLCLWRLGVHLSTLANGHHVSVHKSIASACQIIDSDIGQRKQSG